MFGFVGITAERMNILVGNTAAGRERSVVVGVGVGRMEGAEI
jgi:hypothetical protein